MLRIMLLILIIQANCMKIYCDEESLDGELRTTETTTEISEETLSHSASAESLKSPVETKEINEESNKASKDGAEFRVSRSSSNNPIEEETQVDDTSKVHSAEASFTEKSAPDEVTVETSQQDDKEVNKLKTETNFTETHQDKTISVDGNEKQSEDLSEQYSSVAGTEDRKSVELLEASAESKINDYEKGSSKIDETDRNFENGEIKEISIESGLDQSLPTRRMLSGPDYIVTVLDTKTRADTTPAELDLEVKIVPSQKFNTYNNFNEFGTQGNFKLMDPSQAELTTPPIPIRTITPVTTRIATPEILEQQYLPKYYPQAELNMRFPNVNSDFQGPRDLPVYLKIKQDELLSQDQFIGAHNSPFKQTQPTDENTYFYPKIQQQSHQPHRTMDSGRMSSNKQFQNLGIESRNQVPQFQNQFQNPLQMNVEFANRYQNSRNQVQQFHQIQELGNFNRKHFDNVNRNPRNQIQRTRNTNFPLNNKELRNEYPYYPSQMVMEQKFNLEHQQIKSDNFAKPYPYLPRPSQQEINLPKTLITTDTDIVPKKVKVLFQKLANASQFPMKMSPNLFSNHINNNMKNYGYFINPNIRSNILYAHEPR